MKNNTDENINKSIGCTVTQCKYHDNSDYCTLNHINVINSVQNATDTDSPEVTDCGSYEKNQ